MIPLWTASELIRASRGRMSAPFDATGISIDTRSLRPRDLFIALRGENGDGHDHIAAAFAAGATGVMVHCERVPLPLREGSGEGSERSLLVDDTLSGLTRLGAAGRARFTGQLVAVTGSVGKTTTKEMLRTILAAQGATHAAAGSHNNHWGVPLTLARLPPDASFCVIEIGMNHAGEVAPLARLARPHVAVITSIAKAHVGNLGSLAAIAEEKAAIMRGLDATGIAVLPADLPFIARLRAAAEGVMTFGTTVDADVRLVGLTQTARSAELRVAFGGRDLCLRFAAPGQHMASNALAAVAAATALGVAPEAAAAALDGFTPSFGARRAKTNHSGGRDRTAAR